MNKLIKIDKLDKPEIPEDWDYNESVKNIKGFIYKMKNLTEEILNELWIARGILSKSGATGHIKNLSDANAPLKTWNDYCEEIGEDKSTVNRWLKAYEEADFSVHFLSNTSEWNTPLIIIDNTIKLLGNIDLDPCSNEGEPNISADEHYTEKEDGLSKEWHGNVYMNPPYGREIKKWVDYICDQFEKGNIQGAIALLPSRTDTDWFQRLRKYPRCFIKGRLKFSDNGNSAPFPSMAVYLGKNTDKFIRVFSELGDIYGLKEAWISQ